MGFDSVGREDSLVFVPGEDFRMGREVPRMSARWPPADGILDSPLTRVEGRQ